MKIYIFTYDGGNSLAFIKARSRSEAEAAGKLTLGTLTFVRESSAADAIILAKGAPNQRMFEVSEGGDVERGIKYLNDVGTTQVDDSAEMTRFFGDLNLNRFDVGFDDDTAPTEAFSFRPGFEAALRQSGIDARAGGGGGVRGALASKAFEPLVARATMHAAFNPITGDFNPEATQEDLLREERTFQNYLKSQAAAKSLYGRSGAQAARGLFEQARTLSGDPIKALAALGEGGGISGQFLNPATIGQGSVLANVAREGARQRFGSFARYLPSAQDLAQTYLSYAPETQGPQQQSFADFLQNRIYGGAGVAGMAYGN